MELIGTELLYHDSIVGTVEYTTKKGCFVKADIADTYLFYYGCGEIGDRVMLTVRKFNPYLNSYSATLEAVISRNESVA